MKLEIAVLDDKTCSVGIVSEYGGFYGVKGLTPEQAVELKKLCLAEYERGRSDQYLDTWRLIQGREPKKTSSYW